MAARFVLTAARGLAVAASLMACSSLPDLTFDGASDGGPAGKCSCQSVPAGWTPVSVAAASRPPCPASATPKDLRLAKGDGTPTCSCTCGDANGGCGTDDFTLTLTTEATCGVAPATARIPVDVSACTALGSPIMVPNGAFAKAVRPSPTTCTAKAGLTSAVTDGRLCEAPPAGTCGADEACVPASGNGFDSCITKLGTEACPRGFPNRSTAGTSADESKACLGCACGAPAACTGGSVSVYDAAGCKTNGQAHGATDISSTCASTSEGNFTGTHFKSTPPAGGCAATPKTPPVPGTLTFTDTRTVCCK